MIIQPVQCKMKTDMIFCLTSIILWIIGIAFVFINEGRIAFYICNIGFALMATAYILSSNNEKLDDKNIYNK